MSEGTQRVGPVSAVVVNHDGERYLPACLEALTELELDDVENRYPAEHYVLVDDKLRILNAVKKAWGSRVTTVFPRQGNYALDSEVLAQYPPADLSIERIGDLLTYDMLALIKAGRPT